MRRKQITFWILFLAYTSIYIARLNLSMASPSLIAENRLDAAQVGFLGSIFSTVYSVGRLLNGAASDTTPPWRMLTIGLALAGISNLLIGFFPPYLGIFVLWMANAYAQSMLWSSVLSVVTRLYGKAAKRKMSVMVTSVAVGNILGIILNTWFITRLGVSYAFFLPGAITIFLCVLTFFATRKIPPAAEEQSEHLSFFALLRQRELLEMIFPAAFHGVMKENISLWMAVFFIDRYAVDLNTTSYYVLLIPVIGLVGRVLYPIAFRACGEREHRVSMLGFFVCVLASVVLLIGKIGILAAALALGLIYTAVSMINTSFLSIYPLHYAKTHNEAAVSGIMDFATYLGAGVSSAIYGTVIQHFGYLPMFLSWTVISALSLMILKNFAEKKEVIQYEKNDSKMV